MRVYELHSVTKLRLTFKTGWGIKSLSTGHRAQTEVATMTDFDREWVESIAGRPVTDDEVREFLVEFNVWIDLHENS